MFAMRSRSMMLLAADPCCADKCLTREHGPCVTSQSELPFRMLCRAHGATAAYTPMLHARLFAEVEKYRAEHFTTTASAVDRSGDRFDVLLQTLFVLVKPRRCDHLMRLNRACCLGGTHVDFHSMHTC